MTSKSKKKSGSSDKGVSPIGLQKHLKGVEYPASRDQLIEHARSHGAGDDVLHVLEQMPDHDYSNPAEVMKGFGEIDTSHGKGRSAS